MVGGVIRVNLKVLIHGPGSDMNNVYELNFTYLSRLEQLMTFAVDVALHRRFLLSAAA